MTPEQKRIAIAEACGWTILDTPTLYGDFACYAKDPSGQEFPGIPDYLNDLNAMHEAEKMLGLKYDQWTRELRSICERDRQCVESATAAQRAQALLKTLGLWGEKTDCGFNDELFDLPKFQPATRESELVEHVSGVDIEEYFLKRKNSTVSTHR